MAQVLNMIAAQQILERKAVARRDYQDANIAKATAEYIEALEKELAELKEKDDGDAREAELSDAGADGDSDGTES